MKSEINLTGLGSGNGEFRSAGRLSDRLDMIDYDDHERLP